MLTLRFCRHRAYIERDGAEIFSMPAATEDERAEAQTMYAYLREHA